MPPLSQIAVPVRLLLPAPLLPYFFDMMSLTHFILLSSTDSMGNLFISAVASTSEPMRDGRV